MRMDGERMIDSDNLKQHAAAGQLATEHVEWFTETVAPLLQTFFEHGFKHGVDWQKKQEKTE